MRYGTLHGKRRHMRSLTLVQRGRLVAALGVITLMLGWGTGAQALLIDNFGTIALSVSDLGGGGASTGSSVTGGVGAERDLIVESAGLGNVGVTINLAGQEKYAHSQASGTTGTSEVQWDGALDGGSSTLNFDLGGVDITDGGTSTQLSLELVSTDFGGDITFRFYDNNAANFAETTFSPAPLTQNTTFSALFTNFAITGTVDFTSIDAITMRVDGSLDNDLDLTLDLLATNAPPVPNPEPGTMLLLSTGLVGLLGYGWRRKQKEEVTA